MLFCVVSFHYVVPFMTTQPFGCNSIQYLANFADIPWKTDFGISLISTFSIIFNFFIGLFFVSCYFFTFYKKKGNIDLLFFVAICMCYIRFVPIRDLVVFFFFGWRIDLSCI